MNNPREFPVCSDPGETREALARLGSELWQKALRAAGDAHAPSANDPLGLAGAMLQLYGAAIANPAKLAEAQVALWTDYAKLAHTTMQRFLGIAPPPVIEPEAGDRRFVDDAWAHNPVFDSLKQAYLLTCRAWEDLVADMDGLDEKARDKLAFSFRQTADALAPSNFALTNPEVIRATVASGGRNLVEGFSNLMADMADANGPLDIKTVEKDAFEVGVNLAVTPGKVIYQNDLMQLIQYAPTTETVYRRPLLLIPPWMNKFYIMDLRPGNSMVQWLVDQGHTIFMISWVNPDERLAHKGFEDYMLEGPVAALDAIRDTTGEEHVNVAGYCLGGILLAATMAWLAAKGDRRVTSATYLTTMVDFSDPGEVGLFIDEEGLASLEKQIEERGYLDGKVVDLTFRTLRANDLIWSFYVQSYLLGKSPRPFDLLYWNADSTNMPAAMHTYFMRNMYLENRLREPGGITLAGVPIDVTLIETPAYVLSTREDHIAPWKSTYAATQLFKGPVEFVLGASGHIAGVINPPLKDKYGYWTGNALPADPEEWLAKAKRHAGSWWPHWMRWLAPHAGDKVAARTPGEGKLPALEDAPGSYVMRKI